MYAPKFRSWMTSWDRFEETQESRIQAQGDAIMADVRRQIAEAIPKEPEKTEQYNPYLKVFPGDLARMAQQQVNAFEQFYQSSNRLGSVLLDGLGGVGVMDFLSEPPRS